MHFRYFIILITSLFLVILLFPYLDYYFYFRHFEKRTEWAIPIGRRGDAPRVALKLHHPLLKFSSGYQVEINTQRCH